MAKPFLYIHGGINKTGTTSIQSFLSKNYANFLIDSILYPKTGRDEMMQHHCFFSSIRIPEHPYFKPKKSFDDYISDLKDEIALHNPRKVILSSEIFCDLSSQEPPVLKAKLDTLFRLFSGVKVLFYIRRPDKYAISNNNTMIWYGRRKKHHLIFPDLLAWKRYIANEQLLFKPFEKGQFIGGTIFSDFLSAVEIKPRDYYEYPPKELNESIEDDIIELFRLLNNAHPEVTRNNEFKYLLLQAFPQKGKAKNAFFSPTDRLSIIEKYSKDIQTIAKEYMGRKDGILFHEPLPDPNEPFEPYKGLSIETVVQAFSYVLFKHQEQIANLQNSIQNLNSQLNRQNDKTGSINELVTNHSVQIEGLWNQFANHEEQNRCQWDQLKLQWEQINNYNEQAITIWNLLIKNKENNELLFETIHLQQQQLKSNLEEFKNLLEKQNEYLQIIEHQNERIERIEKQLDEMGKRLSNDQ
jgi:hypothetical protein